ncbi:hypothetical protein MKW94_010282 [Papaver nudicaule]|uniref:Uncharacterized protein n=1 Tax=Papaver nudicaule TaxID=74823 RepID=A0AA42AWB3_PAPNU|nr:hypothetical protein [Papaver nudicaule]
MSFTLQAAKEFGIPDMLYWPINVCAFDCVLHFPNLIQRGLVPLKDESYLTNGYLDTLIDWIPGVKDIRFRDLPSFVRTTVPNDAILDFFMRETGRAHNAAALIFNTFDALEMEAVDAAKSELPLPPVYTVGPLHLLLNQIPLNESQSLGSNLWIEDTKCLKWLDTKEPNSVVYVNFGSITVMTTQQLTEFAWGLANSKYNFLWIIRPDLVVGESATLPPEFAEEIKERGLIADQQTNCRYSCNHWGFGMEIDSNVQRGEVERLVRELMVGEKGKNMKKNAMEWKQKAAETISPGGSSCVNIDKIVNEILASKITDH